MTGKPVQGSKRQMAAEKHKAELAAGPQEGPKNGRPRPLDNSPEILAKTLQTIVGCGSIWCTKAETAAVLGVAITTLDHFWTKYPESKEAWHAAFETGRASLRRTQVKLSEKSPEMAKWLGMQQLGQRDPHRVRELEIREAEAKRKAADGAVLDIRIEDLTTAQLVILAAKLRQVMAANGGKLPAPDEPKLVNPPQDAPA